MPLEVSATPAGSTVSLEQFDLQGPGIPIVAFAEGWQEPEYNPDMGRPWRWMSERSVLWIRPVGRDVVLTLTGESPLRYYKDAPRVQVIAGDSDVGAFAPSSDFTYDITIPATALSAAQGRVTVKSSRFFVPGGSGGGGDQRHLAIRMYGVTVR